MNKEQQDKLWNELSEESKKFVKSLYYDVKDPNRELYDYEDRAQKELLESICGEHNLNPKPQIKTWEDVEQQGCDVQQRCLYDLGSDGGVNDMLSAIAYNGDFSTKIIQKAIATLKIAKLIELGYGGMVSEKEWKNKDLFKYYIVIGLEGKLVIDGSYENWQEFISFHSKELSEEFMSHESNRKLVEQYYMM